MTSIGVDIGGTKTLIARVTDGSIAASRTIPTHEDPREAAKEIAEAVCELWSDDVVGVGVGLPGYVHKGVLHHCPNLPLFIGVHIEEILSTAIGSHVVCENDANCFALAEHRLGAGKDCEHMLGVILGTGVGSGIIINSQLYTGTIGGAGEVGDILLREGSWEDQISGPGIMRAYASFGGESCEHPGDVWRSSEDAAQKTREHTLVLLGRFLGSLINVFNPEKIVLGGSVSTLPFYDDLPKHVQPHCSEASFAACQIVKHGISEHAGVIGAAMLVR